MFDRERLVSFFSSHRTSGSLWAIALSRRGRDDTESPTNESTHDADADAMDEQRVAASAAYLLAVLVLSLVVSDLSSAGVAPTPPEVLSSPAAAGEGAEHEKKKIKKFFDRKPCLLILFHL